MKFIYYISLLLGIILLQNCAQISAPTGGDPDIIPPALDSNGTVPLNYSTNFKGNQIVLTFNEYFVLKNPTANVFFSPSIENEPKFITKGKTLTILFERQLKENTTYTINFGDAISDYTVGNKILDFKYVFSTGDYIDSMSTRGKVIDAFTGKPAEGVVVMLYEDFSDSIVSKSKPIYYSVTDKQGNYLMNYLKSGTYKLFALKDGNRNFLYDLPNEQLAGKDSLISLFSDTVPSYSVISIFTKDYKKQALTTKKYYYPGKLVMTFARTADSITIYKSDSTELKYESIEINEKRDSVVIWKPNLGLEKSTLKVWLDTTLEAINIYPFPAPKKAPNLKAKPKSRTISKNKPFTLVFEQPIDSFSINGVTVFKDTNELALSSVSKNNQSLILVFDSKEDESYKYLILPNTVTDIFGIQNTDTITGRITIRKDDYFGSFTLKLKPKNDSVNYLISILDDKGNLIEKQTASGVSEVNFKNLKPGEYSIKAVEDLNQNGKWDTGDYYLKKKPEQVFYFPMEIEIRSNWEMAESWGI